MDAVYNTEHTELYGIIIINIIIDVLIHFCFTLNWTIDMNTKSPKAICMMYEERNHLNRK